MVTKEGIVLIYSTSECWYESFLYGIEEEGVAIHCIEAAGEEAVEKYDALTMATLAAGYSVFEIGVGVDKDSVVIRHRLQKETEPLLEVNRKAGNEIIRLQGSNTARLVKKTPLFLNDEQLWKQEL